MDSEPRNRQGSGADERQHERIRLPPPSATLCAATTSAFGFGARFVHIDCASAKLSTIEPRDGLLAFFVIRHFDETEASRPACLAISQNARTLHMSISLEKLAQLVFGRVEAEIANEDVFQVASFSVFANQGETPRKTGGALTRARKCAESIANPGTWASGQPYRPFDLRRARPSEAEGRAAARTSYTPSCMATSHEVTSARPELVRELGASHATAVVVGVVIGSGIFLVPAEMIQAAGSARLVYLAWVVGGIFSFFGALTYAELGAMKPQAGGEYVYIRDAYGPLAGFLCGWTWTVVVKPSSLAAISTGIVRILANFPQLSFLSLPIGHVPVTWGQLVAIGFVFLISAINYIGVKRAGNFQLAFTILKVVLIIAIAALAFSSRGDWGHFAERYAGGTGGIVGFVAAVAAALWAYDGWSDVNMVAEEVRSPERNIPLALVGGLLMIGVLYMLVNAAVQYALPLTLVATSSSPMSDAVKTSFLGGIGAAVVSGVMVISLMTSLNGVAMSGARMTFAVARDGNLFSMLAKIHPRFHTPHVAIVTQAILTMSFLLMGGSFRQLFTLAIFAEWLSYVTASSALFVFRTKPSTLERPYHFGGYPLAPALFIVASAALLYYTFTSNLRNSILGGLVILAGVPVYYAFALRRKV